MKTGARALFADKVVVVTGAARGIGRATALAFAELGARISGCDLDEAGLDGVLAECRRRGASQTLAETADVADEGSVRAFAQRVEAELGPVFCLVNNAGVALSGGFFDTELDDWSWLLRTNLFGTIHATRAFGGAMRSRKVGRIVNVASASGYCNLPSLAAYGTTKYAVVGLSEALRGELLADGVLVSVVCPGLIASSIIDTARVRGAPDSAAERASLQRLYRRRGHAPERVASAIVSAAHSGKAFVPVTPEAWLLYALKRLAPAALPGVLRLSEVLYRK
jgi:NAD(P)-dependent dehydrogenase (short-subunit alcohol dehydrogenase family)